MEQVERGSKKNRKEVNCHHRLGSGFFPLIISCNFAIIIARRLHDDLIALPPEITRLFLWHRKVYGFIFITSTTRKIAKGPFFPPVLLNASGILKLLFLCSQFTQPHFHLDFLSFPELATSDPLCTSPRCRLVWVRRLIASQHFTVRAVARDRVKSQNWWATRTIPEAWLDASIDV